MTFHIDKVKWIAIPDTKEYAILLCEPSFLPFLDTQYAAIEKEIIKTAPRSQRRHKAKQIVIKKNQSELKDQIVASIDMYFTPHSHIKITFCGNKKKKKKKKKERIHA